MQNVEKNKVFILQRKPLPPLKPMVVLRFLGDDTRGGDPTKSPTDTGHSIPYGSDASTSDIDEQQFIIKITNKPSK